jgi:hypothetical protein
LDVLRSFAAAVALSPDPSAFSTYASVSSISFSIVV